MIPREGGGELPTTIDWADPRWRAFQRKREDWITEFTALTTSTVKRVRPEATVEHQLSSIRAPWRYGITDRVLGLSDYAAGDFYGGFREHSFIANLYHNATTRLPFEFHTSRCPTLLDHTTIAQDSSAEEPESDGGDEAESGNAEAESDATEKEAAPEAAEQPAMYTLEEINSEDFEWDAVDMRRVPTELRNLVNKWRAAYTKKSQAEAARLSHHRQTKCRRLTNVRFRLAVGWGRSLL